MSDLYADAESVKFFSKIMLLYRFKKVPVLYADAESVKILSKNYNMYCIL